MTLLGLTAFRLLLEHPEPLWKAWCEDGDVVDPEEAGIVLATGLPELDRQDALRRLAGQLKLEGALDDYWTFLAENDGVALDQGGGGPPRAAKVATSELFEPVIWPARSAQPAALAGLTLPWSDDTLAFGELTGSGYLCFRAARAGFFGRGRKLEVWFYDLKEPSRPATKLADTFDAFLLAWVEHKLRLPSLLSARDAAGW